MISIEFTLPIFVLLVSTILGLLVFLNGLKEKINRVFAFLVLAGAFWVLSVFFADIAKNYNLALFWTKAAIVGPTLVGILLYYFSLIFPKDDHSIGAFKKLFILVPPVLILLLAPTSLNVKSIQLKDWGTDFIPGPLYYFVFGYLIFYVGMSLKNLKTAYQKTKPKSIERYQIIYLLTALFGAFVIGIITNLVLPTLGYGELSKYGPSLSILFFSSFTSIAVLKHHLFNTKVILTEALVFVLIGILVIKIPVSKTSSELIFNIIILVLTIGIGRALIKNVLDEIKRREETETLSKELQKTYQELKKLDEAKSEFISIASHQLRTPLTAIKGYISMILEGSYGELAEKAKASLKKVYQANERLIKLVNDLLNLSRIEAGRVEIEKEKTSIEEVVASAIETLKIEAQVKDLYLKLEKPKTTMPQIMSDKQKTIQAVLNIIDNAIRYTNEGGIVINLKKEKDNVLIEVKDTGAGMDEEELAGLFESFSRGKTGSHYWTEGIGLGLYVAQKFIGLQGGRVWAESEGKGKGSTFYIELPV